MSIMHQRKIMCLEETGQLSWHIPHTGILCAVLKVFFIC